MAENVVELTDANFATEVEEGIVERVSGTHGILIKRGIVIYAGARCVGHQACISLHAHRADQQAGE